MELMDCLRDKGLLVMCMVLTVPFLLPMSIPGSSTPFGLAIALIGLGVVAGKTPRLPGKIMNRPISAENLFTVLDKGSGLFKKDRKLYQAQAAFFSLRCYHATGKRSTLGYQRHIAYASSAPSFFQHLAGIWRSLSGCRKPGKGRIPGVVGLSDDYTLHNIFWSSGHSGGCGATDFVVPNSRELTMIAIIKW